MPGMQRQPMFRRLFAQHPVKNVKGKVDGRLGLKRRQWGVSHPGVSQGWMSLGYLFRL